MRRLLLVLPLLLLPACGGDEDAEAKAAYVEQAEATCTKANEARAALGTPSAVTAIPEYVRSVVQVAADAAGELAGLEPPAADADELQEKFVGPLQEQVEAGQAYAEQVEAAGRTGDSAAVLRLLGSAPTQTTADLDFLRDYGFTACVTAADTGAAAGG